MKTRIVSDIAIAMFKAINFASLNPSVEPHEENFVKKIQEYMGDPNHRCGIKKFDGQLAFWWLSEANFVIVCPIMEDMFLFSQLGLSIGDKIKRLGEKVETDSEKDLIIISETMVWKAILKKYDPSAEMYQYFK